MWKIGWLVLVGLLLYAPADAAVRTTLQNASTATGDGNIMSVDDKGAAGLTVKGTFVGTIAFKGSADGGITWTARQCLTVDTFSGVTTTTTTGQYLCHVAGLSHFKAEITAYTSGSITVIGTASNGSDIGALFDTNGNLLVSPGTCLSGESACVATSPDSYMMVTGAVMRTYTVMTGVTTNTTSATTAIPSGGKTPIARVDGTGAVTATVTYFGAMTSTAANGISLCVVTLSGTTRHVKGCDGAAQFSTDYPFYYASTTNVTGTGATVIAEVTIGVASSGSSTGGDASAANQTTQITALQLIDDDQTGATACVLISTASTNATNCKASAGRALFGHFVNTTATLAYVRLYNLSSAPTCSSATGFVESIPVAASATGAGISFNYAPTGQAFATGIGWCITGGGSSTDNTNAVAGVYVKLGYK